MKTLLFLGMCFALASCDNLKIKLPATDSTRPVVVWNVTDTESKETHEYAPTSLLSIPTKRGAQYQIALKASDPDGGIKYIKLNTNSTEDGMSWHCDKGSPTGVLKQDLHPLFKSQVQNLSPNADGTVLTSILLLQDVDLTMPCQDASWHYNEGAAQLTGEAGNYHDGVTTSVLRFNVLP